MTSMCNNKLTLTGCYFSFMVFLPLMHPCCAADENPRDIGAFLSEAMISHAQSFPSGEYKAKSRETLHDGDGQLLEELTSEFSSTFDFQDHRIRFDFQCELPAPKNYRYIETADKTVVYSTVTGFQITKGPFDNARKRSFGFLDVRDLGLRSSAEIRRGALFSEKVDKLRDVLSELEGSRNHDSRIWKLSGIFRGLAHITFEIDEVKGFAPVRFHRAYLNKSGEARADFFEETTTEWEQRSDVWVPKRVVMTSVSPDDKSVREVVLEWLHVNHVVDDAKFREDDWVLAPGTMIVDHVDPDAEPNLIDVVDDPANEKVAKPTRNSWVGRGILAAAGAILLLGTYLKLRK